MDLSQLFMVSLILACLPLSQSYRNGARQESCYNMLVMHAGFSGRIVPPNNCGSPCQYQLSMIGRVSGEADLNTVEERNSTTYQCGQIYHLRLSSQPGSTFDGFMVEARESTDSFDEGSTIWGTWVPDPSDANYHAVTCNRSNDSSVGPFENAATQNGPRDFTSVDLWWKAPQAEEQLPQQIRFWFVAVQQRLTYYFPVAGPTLHDIDECAEANAELNNCEQNCNNTVCSFECSCWQGYQPVEGAPNRCEDIDECQLGVHSCQQLCTNTDGSFQCGCTAGFQVDSNGSCIDIDECQLGVHSCQQLCTNTDGSFQCSCTTGFQVDSNGSCIDVDECSVAAIQGMQLCPGTHLCTNQIGSYQCICPPGTLPTTNILPGGSLNTSCAVPMVGSENFLATVLDGVTVREFLERGRIDSFIEITVNVTYWYCVRNGCGADDFISTNGTSSQMTLQVTRESLSVVVDIDSVRQNADGDLAFSFFINVAVAGQMYILNKNTALAAVQSGAQLYANQFGGSVSFTVVNPDPTVATTETPTGLSTGAIVGIVFAVVLVTLVLLVFLALGYYFCTQRLGKKEKSKSSDKKVLPTAGTDWADAGGQVPLSPLPTSQDSPPASTEAVEMANEGAPTDPAPPTQM